jgi:hypothetical protein
MYTRVDRDGLGGGGPLWELVLWLAAEAVTMPLLDDREAT